MAAVTFKGVTRRFPGASKNAVDALDLEIADGEFLVLVGPSGCGKSTTLRMLAGLDPVDEGEIFVGDQNVTDTAPENRDIAMVFQNYALYPHMTVANNMGFGLRTRKTPKAEIEARVREVAKMLDLEDLLDRQPSDLSGGQRQRVAMGRAIVRRPQVFLMDEPLSNLDAKLRVQTRAQITSLQRELGTTTVYVTHDQTEAMTMGHRIAVLNDGQLQQLGTPRELYDYPANEFVGRFIGSPAMSVWTAEIRNGVLKFGDASVPLPAGHADGPVRAGVRPEDFRIVAADEPGIDFTVEIVEELGSVAYLYGEAQLGGSGEAPTDVVVRRTGRDHPERGASVRIGVDPERVHLFDAETGDRVSLAS